MKAIFFSIFSIFFLFSCQKKSENFKDDIVSISERVSYMEDGGRLKIKVGKFENVLNVQQIPFQRVVLLSSSLVGYFLELGVEGKIVGISSPEYIYSDKIHQLIQKGKIQNIGNEQKYDVEKILALKPELVFTNYVPSFENTYDVLRENGIGVIFVDEYLEEKALDKARYLLLFGKLFGIESLAQSKYQMIEQNYNRIKQWASEEPDRPLVLCNEMYGNQWFLPEGESFIAKMIEDAGGHYLLKNVKGKNAVPLSFEEVYVKAADAKYWINISPHQSKRDLLFINPNYDKMKVFHQGKLYMINNKDKANANDYFESGVVRADLVLRDYFKIFHPNHPKVKDLPLVYMKELN